MRTIQTGKNFNFDKRILYSVVFLITFLSILRGIRFPNIWSYSHYLFNYDFGFIKRGLLGEIISQFGSAYLLSYNFFFILSLTVFLINVFLIISIIKELIDSTNPIQTGCAVIYSSSLALVFLSHTIGYFDHLGLFITLVSLKITGFYKKLFFLLILLPFVLLIHEAILILFFPVLFMSLLFSINQKKFKQQILLLIIFSAFVLLIVFIVNRSTLDKSSANQMYVQFQAKIENPLREDAFYVLHRKTEDNILIMNKIWSNGSNVTTLLFSLLITAPVFLFFIYFSTKLLIELNYKYYLTVLSVPAALSPLVLHFFAWDLHRWNTLTITTSFLMLYITYQSVSDDQSVKTPNSIYPLIIFMVFLSGISSIHLFDGYYVKNFPFLEHLKYVVDFIHGKEVFPDVPPR